MVRENRDAAVIYTSLFSVVFYTYTFEMNEMHAEKGCNTTNNSLNTHLAKIFVAFLSILYHSHIDQM